MGPLIVVVVLGFVGLVKILDQRRALYELRELHTKLHCSDNVTVEMKRIIDEVLDG